MNGLESQILGITPVGLINNVLCDRRRRVDENWYPTASIPSAFTFFSVSFTIRIGLKSEDLGINVIRSAFQERISTDRGMSSHLGRLVVQFGDSYTLVVSHSESFNHSTTGR